MNNVLWPPPWHMPRPDYENTEYANKTNSVPADAYTRAFWVGGPDQQVWLDPLDYNQYYGPLDRVSPDGFRAVWTSPILDMRPDLKGSMSAPPIAIPIRGAGYGLGIEIAIQVTYSEITIPFRVFSLEFSHLSDPTKARRMNNVQDITPDFYDAQVNNEGSSVTLTFRPTASTRFWRTSLIFDALNELGPVDPATLPRISIESASW